MTTSVSQRRSLFIILLCIVLALLVFAIYGFTSASVGGGQPVMPLDDAYIHFQYAHQLAAGQPYVYNPGLPPTSGATSFLYPYVLALGDVLGLRELNLGWWAMGIGAGALALAAWLVYRIVLLAAPFWLAAVFAAAFALDGWVSWHFMSGMETGLVVLFVLLAFYAVLERRCLTVLALTLLALIRPEGGLLAAISVGIVLLQAMRALPVKGANRIFQQVGLPPRWLWRREWLLLLLPLAAIGVQPLVNLLLTGSAIASGNAAKSIFGIVPVDATLIVQRVGANFVRIWSEFLTVHFYVSAMALIGLAALAKRSRLTAVMLVLWLLAGTAAIATLDNAFWHFKRYQLPLIALFFPLAGWGWAFVYARLRRLLRHGIRRAQPARLAFIGAIFGALIAVSVSTLLRNSLQFVSNEALNVGYVVAQPLQMARWLAQNASQGARVAVHDVGMMRYVGGRTTIDMVGLTTPGAAAYWRNGPGAVGEFLDRQRPDLIASYGREHGVGLVYLEETDLYAETLATYTVALDPLNNVALAGQTQGIYRPNWAAADRSPDVRVLNAVTPYLDGKAVVDFVDVADIASEDEHGYRWRSSAVSGKFFTEFFQLNYAGCLFDCSVMDGGRRIDVDEAFTLHLQEGQEAMLVTRLLPMNAGTFDVYANDQLVGTRVVPELPGMWLEVPTLIPAALVTAETNIRVVPHLAGDYMPYYHWAYQGNPYQPLVLDGQPLAMFQAGAVQIMRADLGTEVDTAGASSVQVGLAWQTDGNAQGDAKIFVHLVNDAGEIVAQADARPAHDSLPPGNWLPGSFLETINVAAPPGNYRVLLGLYDPATLTRYTPESDSADPDGRVLVGEIEVQ